jgi:hypothetical protein
MNEQQPWRTFSIFINSRFADMQAECDYLMQIVFSCVNKARRVDDNMFRHQMETLAISLNKLAETKKGYDRKAIKNIPFALVMIRLKMLRK